jgi:hypothetical protein
MSTVQLTRVEQTYEQLRHHVPQLKHIPSVLIQLIAEYGPPSIWLVYHDRNVDCYALYPAAVIETLDRPSNRRRSPARNRSPSRSTTTTTTESDGETSAAPLDWSNGWQILKIHPHVQPPQSSPPSLVWHEQYVTHYMKYKEWSFDEWIIRSAPSGEPQVLHLPHDQPVTKVWTYPLPPVDNTWKKSNPRPIIIDRCSWCYDTG